MGHLRRCSAPGEHVLKEIIARRASGALVAVKAAVLSWQPFRDETGSKTKRASKKENQD